MLSSQNKLNFSPYAELYDKIIPKDNLLRRINENIDFSFILEELKAKYCPDNGR
ncbi:MAG: IS5/IS1182 family transposase, partial [Treponema sp.]